MTYDSIMQHKHIWAYMYGYPVCYPQCDVLVRYATENLLWLPDKSAFIYIWGWPGPDYNMYQCDDYKKTWCFNPAQMPDVPVHPLDIKYLKE